MLVLTTIQAQAVAHAVREARTLAAYVRLLNRSKRKPDEVIVNQADRLHAALQAMDKTKEQDVMYTQYAGTYYRSGLEAC
jgi:hypothetical protein